MIRSLRSWVSGDGAGAAASSPARDAKAGATGSTWRRFVGLGPKAGDVDPSDPFEVLRGEFTAYQQDVIALHKALSVTLSSFDAYADSLPAVGTLLAAASSYAGSGDVSAAATGYDAAAASMQAQLRPAVAAATRDTVLFPLECIMKSHAELQKRCDERARLVVEHRKALASFQKMQRKAASASHTRRNGRTSAAFVARAVDAGSSPGMSAAAPSASAAAAVAGLPPLGSPAPKAGGANAAAAGTAGQGRGGWFSSAVSRLGLGIPPASSPQVPAPQTPLQAEKRPDGGVGSVPAAAASAAFAAASDSALDTSVHSTSGAAESSAGRVGDDAGDGDTGSQVDEPEDGDTIDGDDDDGAGSRVSGSGSARASGSGTHDADVIRRQHTIESTLSAGSAGDGGSAGASAGAGVAGGSGSSVDTYSTEPAQLLAQQLTKAHAARATAAAKLSALEATVRALTDVLTGKLQHTLSRRATVTAHVVAGVASVHTAVAHGIAAAFADCDPAALRFRLDAEDGTDADEVVGSDVADAAASAGGSSRRVPPKLAFGAAMPTPDSFVPPLSPLASVVRHLDELRAAAAQSEAVAALDTTAAGAASPALASAAPGALARAASSTSLRWFDEGAAARAKARADEITRRAEERAHLIATAVKRDVPLHSERDAAAAVHQWMRGGAPADNSATTCRSPALALVSMSATSLAPAATAVLSTPAWIARIAEGLSIQDLARLACTCRSLAHTVRTSQPVWLSVVRHGGVEAAAVSTLGGAGTSAAADLRSSSMDQLRADAVLQQARFATAAAARARFWARALGADGHPLPQWSFAYNAAAPVAVSSAVPPPPPSRPVTADELAALVHIAAAEAAPGAKQEEHEAADGDMSYQSSTGWDGVESPVARWASMIGQDVQRTYPAAPSLTATAAMPTVDTAGSAAGAPVSLEGMIGVSAAVLRAVRLFDSWSHDESTPVAAAATTSIAAIASPAVSLPAPALAVPASGDATSPSIGSPVVGAHFGLSAFVSTAADGTAAVGATDSVAPTGAAADASSPVEAPPSLPSPSAAVAGAGIATDTSTVDGPALASPPAVDEWQATAHTTRRRRILYDILMATAASEPFLRYTQGMATLARLIVELELAATAAADVDSATAAAGAAATDAGASASALLAGRPDDAVSARAFNILSALLRLGDTATHSPGDSSRIRALMPGLGSLYSHDVQTVRMRLYELDRLLVRYLPQVAGHLQREGIQPDAFATPWLLTLCADFSALGIADVACLWDRFMVGGWAEVCDACLGILAAVEDHLLTLSMEECLRLLRAPRAIAFCHSAVNHPVVCGTGFRRTPHIADGHAELIELEASYCSSRAAGPAGGAM